MTLYKCALFVLWWQLGAAGVASVYSYLSSTADLYCGFQKLRLGYNKKCLCVFNYVPNCRKVPVIPCWHGPICHSLSEAPAILVLCVLPVSRLARGSGAGWADQERRPCTTDCVSQWVLCAAGVTKSSQWEVSYSASSCIPKPRNTSARGLRLSTLTVCCILYPFKASKYTC